MSWINKLTNKTISRDPVLEKLDGKVFKSLSEAEQSQIQDKDDLFYPNPGQTLHTLSRAGAVALIDNQWKEFIGDPDSLDTAEEFKSNLNKLSNHAGVKYFVNNCISQNGFTQAGLTHFKDLVINSGYKCDFEETRTIMVPLADGSIAIRVILDGYKLVKMPTSADMFGDSENIQSNISLIESEDNKPLITFDTTYLISPHKDDSARLTVQNHYQIINDERINKYLPKFKPSLFQKIINYLENNPIKTVLSILAGAGLVAGAIFLAPIALLATGIGATFAAAVIASVSTLTGSVIAGSAVALGGIIGGFISAIVKKITNIPYQPPKILNIPSHHNLIFSLKKGLENYLDSYNLKASCFESFQNNNLPKKIDNGLSAAVAIQKAYPTLVRDKNGKNLDNREQEYIVAVKNFVDAHENKNSIDFKEKMLLEATNIYAAVNSIVNTINKISDERSNLLILDELSFEDTVTLLVTQLETYLKQLQLAIASLKSLDAQNAKLKSLLVQARQLETAIDKQFMKAMGRSMQEFQQNVEPSENNDKDLPKKDPASPLLHSTAKISAKTGRGNAVSQSDETTDSTSTKIMPPIFYIGSPDKTNKKSTVGQQSNQRSHSSQSLA